MRGSKTAKSIATIGFAVLLFDLAQELAQRGFVRCVARQSFIAS
jgi:hypothetical protein